MKIAFYMEDGLEQIVLTPESKIEGVLLDKLREGERNLTIHSGAFYENRAGFVTRGDAGERSTILVLRRPVIEKTVAEPSRTSAPTGGPAGFVNYEFAPAPVVKS